MLVISNHVNQIGMDFPEDSIVRINLAWIRDEKEVTKIIADSYPNKIWLDYPTGRTKPPRPSMSIGEAVSLAKQFDRVEYFAFSNAEDVHLIELLRMVIPDSIELVPKIETIRGVSLLKDIVRSAKTSKIMLDKEDLYLDCDADSHAFEGQVKMVKDNCNYLGVTCLELKGVIFA